MTLSAAPSIWNCIDLSEAKNLIAPGHVDEPCSDDGRYLMLRDVHPLEKQVIQIKATPTAGPNLSHEVRGLVLLIIEDLMQVRVALLERSTERPT